MVTGPDSDEGDTPGIDDLDSTIAGMRAAQRRLDEHLANEFDRGRLNDLSVREPSRLPGWTRGHVLTHLARNADSMTRAFGAARRGDVAERYPGPEGTRDADIEAGANRGAAELLSDVLDSASALDNALSLMTDLAWHGSWRAGSVEGHVAELPWKRWREIELHHGDLALSGFGVDQWSDDFVSLECAHLGLDEDDRSVMSERLGRQRSDPAAWTAATLESGWRRPFGREEIKALDRALRRYEEANGGLDLRMDAAVDFRAEGLDDFVAEIRHRLVEGQGVVAFENFPVERYGDEELRVLWWALSNAIGVPVPQSHRGDLIGDVRDIGTGISGRAGRGYTSSSELNFHADVCDVSGLFFLRTARSGGVTRIASSVTTHDRIAQARPDLLSELYTPMPCSWQNNQPPGETGWYDMPVFGEVDGRSSCAYVRTNLIDAAKNAGAPPLTPKQIEAVEFVKETASEPDMWVERMFGPGAMLFVHNHTVLHLRTAFVDWDEPERKRHLLRIWLSMPNNRQLPQTFESFFDDVGVGALRGGYPSRTGELTFST